MALQVTFDCTDPHAQARFWAVATGFELEDHHDMIGGLIDQGLVAADSDDVVEVDGRRRWRDYAAATAPADGNRLLFQRVAELKTAKNRVHLDLHAGGGPSVPVEEQRANVRAAVSRLQDLGASFVEEFEEMGVVWAVMTDPEGNEFCA